MRTITLMILCAVASVIYEMTLANLFRTPDWSIAFDRAWFTSVGVLVASLTWSE